MTTGVRRTKPAAVKIIGISSGSFSSALKHCQLWFADDSVPRTTVAEYDIVPETHDRRSAGAVRLCNDGFLLCAGNSYKSVP